MTSYDFSVSLTAIMTTAHGALDTAGMIHDTDVADHLPGVSVVGSAVVGAAVAEFADRWNLGLESLVADTEEMATRLAAVAATYAGFEEQGSALAREVIDAIGGTRR